MDVVTLAMAKSYTNKVALGQGAVPMPGPQGPPGEVTEAQLNEALSGIQEAIENLETQASDFETQLDYAATTSVTDGLLDMIEAIQSFIDDPSTIVRGTHNPTTGDVVLSNELGGTVISFNYLQANVAKQFSFDSSTNILTLDVNGDDVTVDLSSMVQTIPPASATVLGGIRLLDLGNGVFDLRTDQAGEESSE